MYLRRGGGGGSERELVDLTVVWSGLVERLLGRVRSVWHHERKIANSAASANGGRHAHVTFARNGLAVPNNEEDRHQKAIKKVLHPVSFLFK
jgi:hypothetical protein